MLFGAGLLLFYEFFFIWHDELDELSRKNTIYLGNVGWLACHLSVIVALISGKTKGIQKLKI